MASKFGSLGDIRNALDDVRGVCQHTSGTLNLVRRTMEDVPLSEWTPELMVRMASWLKEIEAKLDNLLQA